MNSKKIIILNIVLLIASLVFLSFYILRNDKNKSYNKISCAVDDIKPAPPMIFYWSEQDIIKNNIFDKLRGKVLKKSMPQNRSLENKKKQSQFFLVGIFNLNKNKGALINLGSSNVKGNFKRIFNLGDAIVDGYNLSEISDEQVTLTRGEETLILKLKNNNKGKSK